MLAELFGSRAATRGLLYLHRDAEGRVQRIADVVEFSSSQAGAKALKFDGLGLLVSRAGKLL